MYYLRAEKPADREPKMAKTPQKQAADATPESGDSKPLRNVDRMGGFAKGLSVIEAFRQGRGASTIAEIARYSGLDRASARRCLLTLVECGYAKQDGSYFELTPRILRLGNSFMSMSLPRLIRPYLDQLADEVRESCSAAILDRTDVVYILRAVHHGVMGAGLHPGSRLPAFCTGLGRVLLASYPAERALRILKESNRTALTKYTITDIDKLMAELEKIQKNGYAIIDREIEIGSRSIAVPIYNINGEAVAACTVGVHSSTATMKQLRDNYLPHLYNFQAQLAEILP